MKHPAKVILQAAGTLTVVAAVATAALAGTHALTAQRIADNNARVATEARRTVIDADTFEERTLSTADGPVTYYAALSGQQPVGYVFTVVTRGKSAGLTVMTGISADGAITGVTVTEENETAGYVDKVVKGGLMEALSGRRDTDGVDTVSQATKTSSGILDGVKQALAFYEQITA